MPFLNPTHPVIRWSGLRAVIQSSNLLTVVFGAVLIFGLPEALLTDEPACGSARIAVSQMGAWFLYAVLALAVLTIAFPICAPTQFRDFAHQSEYLNGKPQNEIEAAKDTWSAANRERPALKLMLIGLLAICAALFALFVWKSLDFLELSKSCTPLNQALPPTQIHINL